MGTCLNQLTEAVLRTIHNLCFEQKYENYQIFSSESFHFLVVKFSIYLNRHVLIVYGANTQLSVNFVPINITGYPNEKS